MASRDNESISIEMARVIPADVQTATKLAGDEEALHAPPSYDASAPLLRDDGNNNERVTADSTMDDGGKAGPRPSVWLGPLAFLAFLVLFLSPVVFWANVAGTKADLLGFSFLAYLQLFCVILAPAILAIVVCTPYPLFDS
jgi:hypothetical protein